MIKTTYGEQPFQHSINDPGRNIFLKYATEKGGQLLHDDAKKQEFETFVKYVANYQTPIEAIEATTEFPVRALLGGLSVVVALGGLGYGLYKLSTTPSKKKPIRHLATLRKR